MKCPICGKEEFIKSPRLPFDVDGDARLSAENCSCYACTNCGYTMFVDESIVNYVYAQKQTIELIQRKLDEKRNKLSMLKSSSGDLSYLKAQLSKYKKELKTRKELGEDNKTTRALEESIIELTKEIEMGINENAKRAIVSLEQEIKQLEEQLAEIKDTIKPTLLDTDKKERKPMEKEDRTGENIWRTLTAVYQQKDSHNNKTISITKSLSRDSHKLFQLIDKVKKEGYRPYGLNNAASIIVVLDEEEKKLQSRPYLTVLTFKEFIK